MAKSYKSLEQDVIKLRRRIDRLLVIQEKKNKRIDELEWAGEFLVEEAVDFWLESDGARKDYHKALNIFGLMGDDERVYNMKGEPCENPITIELEDEK